MERCTIPSQDFIRLVDASGDAIELMRSAAASLIEQGRQRQATASNDGMGLRTLEGKLEDLAG